jgi:hypothetical protein
MIVNDIVGKMWKEMFMVYFKALLLEELARSTKKLRIAGLWAKKSDLG